jgi:hypothetical protein
MRRDIAHIALTAGEALWLAGCVKAELTSVMGKPLGTQTYRITIADGVISDRRQVEAEDTCMIESYEPI